MCLKIQDYWISVRIMKYRQKKDFEIWVQAAKEGDREAFGNLYAATYDRVYFYLLNMLNSPEDAEDLTQVVFMHALEKLDQLKDGASFHSWVIRIAYSQCINFIKSNWRYDPEEVEANEIEDFSTESNPSLCCLQDERTQKVMESVLSLPPKHRSVILLKYYENLKIRDIALIMSCSEGTVKSRLNAAKSSLNFLLKNQGISSSFWVLSPALSSAAVSMGMPLDTARGLVEGIAETSHLSANFKVLGAAKGLVSMAPLIVTVTTVTVVGGGMAAVDSFMAPEPSVVESATPPAVVEQVVSASDYGQSVPVSVQVDNPESIASAYLKGPNGEQVPLSLSGNVLSAAATENGSYTVVIENKNGESITQSLSVSTVDTENPIITDFSGDDALLTIRLNDSQSGVDPGQIYGVSETGLRFTPESATETEATFKMPEEPCTLYYADKAGNMGHTLVKSRKVPDAGSAVPAEN